MITRHLSAMVNLLYFSVSFDFGSVVGMAKL